MSFNSNVFVFFFMPLVVAIHTVLPHNRLKNYWLLASSIVFYGWCNTRGLAFLMIYGLVNYLVARWAASGYKIKGKIVFGIILDVLVLYVFKYWNFSADMIHRISGLAIPKWDLFQPMGISFITFTTIAYLCDVSRGKVKAVTNIADFYLYLTMFPKAAQGPITYYSQLGPEITDRKLTLDEFSVGLRRFITGLGKKCLIADVLGHYVDTVINSISLGVEPLTAWVAVFFYTFQIFFDFSGYMDMAIGIGQMLGFHLPENFDRPYLSTSVSEFWRRWHMTLGSWFKNYIYIPLGGNRKGKICTVFNLAVVWLLTGIWHGAAVHFILWGIYFGLFVIIEKFIKDKAWYIKVPVAMKWAVTFLIVMFGWVIFRAENISQMEVIFKTMFGFSAGKHILYRTAYFFDLQSVMVFIIAIILTLPMPRKLAEAAETSKTLYAAKSIGYIMIFALSILYMVNSNYNSFIYFQF